mmetsp:Transcript_55144/g.139267  ORF Transcript_55144/g.139267 Transcript_55144/m.139267 type:complete len:215 (-) Transcript_55144:7-651(-)
MLIDVVDRRLRASPSVITGECLSFLSASTDHPVCTLGKLLEASVSVLNAVGKVMSLISVSPTFSTIHPGCTPSSSALSLTRFIVIGTFFWKSSPSGRLVKLTSTKLPSWHLKVTRMVEPSAGGGGSCTASAGGAETGADVCSATPCALSSLAADVSSGASVLTGKLFTTCTVPPEPCSPVSEQHALPIAGRLRLTRRKPLEATNLRHHLGTSTA